MKKNFFIGGCTFLLISFFIISCNNESNEIIETNEQNAMFEAHKEILSSMGYDVSNIEEFDDYYIIEGDIKFNKKDLPSSGISLRHNVYKSTVKGDRVYTIGIQKVFNSAILDIEWIEATKQAINEWNNIKGCKLRFQYAGENNKADILVAADRLIGTGRAAYTDMSTDPNKPGNFIHINPQYNGYSTAQKKFVVAHEIGHALGFGHTDKLETDMSYQKYTAQNDPNSVFRDKAAGTVWSGFSYYDLQAILLLWPEAEETITIHSRDNSPLGYKYNIQIDNSIPGLTYKWEVTGGSITWEQGIYIKVRPSNYYAPVNIKLYLVDKINNKHDEINSKSFVPSSTNVPVQYY